MATDHLETLTKGLRGNNLHGGICKSRAEGVGLDACGIELFKEIDGHTEVHVANAVDLETNGVLAGIKHAVLAGAVVLKLEKIVAVVECENVLGFSGVNKFLCHFSLPHI